MAVSDIERHYADSDALCRAVREHSGGTAILSFSRGKDALASWCKMRRFFDRIVPYYMHPIPELLSFERESLDYYAEKMGTEILTVPHPNLIGRMLKNEIYQSPERCPLLEAAALPPMAHADVERWVRRKAGAPDAWIGIGTRSADSPDRLANIRKHGSLNPARRAFFPVFDWNIVDVEGALRAEGLALPADYLLFDRTLDGIDDRFLEPLRLHHPTDYAKVIRWFPMAGLDRKRRLFAAGAKS